MQGLDLLQDLTILLLAAGLAGVICSRLGLSTIVGFLVAGIVIGPHTPPFSLVTDEARVIALSQVGLVVLMFGIGLGLSLSKFARMGIGTLAATAIGAIAVLVITEAVGALVSWTPLQAMFVAAMLMVSSSAVISKVISELRLTHERSSQRALAVTVLEDVVAVAMLTLLAGRTSHVSGGSASMPELLGGLGAFVVLLIAAGLLLVPRIMRQLETKAEPEIQTLIVAGLMFGLALAAAGVGYSLALGAFLFGAIVAEIPQKPGVVNAFRGMRDVFSSIFFVSIGMMINPALLSDVWPLVLAMTGFALVVRPLACGLALVATGNAPRDARRAALLLTPLGEFSFIIAQLGVTTAVLPPSFYPVAVGSSILTILAAPVVNRHRQAVLRAWERLEPRVVTGALEAYHAWLSDVQARPARTPLWTLVRPRLGQVALEMLFVSGVLIFGGVLLARVGEMTMLRGIDPTSLAWVFWPAVAVVVLFPLVAAWRNCSAIAMMMGECWENDRLPRAAIERALKALAALTLASWVYVVLPSAQFANWGWVAIALGAALVVAGFSRQLVYWHSRWVGSMRDVLADTRGDLEDIRHSARASLNEDLGNWDVAAREVLLPAGAMVAGRTLAELALPARFGSAVLEVERNGQLIRDLGGAFALFPGDRVLLAGERERMEEAGAFLEQSQPQTVQDEDFGRLVLDTSRVTDAHVGRSFSELHLAAVTGVRVVGIHRGEVRIISPGSDERLQAGDELLLLGTLEALQRFQRGLPPRAVPAGRMQIAPGAHPTHA